MAIAFVRIMVYGEAIVVPGGHNLLDGGGD